MMAYGLDTQLNRIDPLGAFERGQRIGYARRLSDINLEKEQEAQAARQRKDISQAARWIMEAPEMEQEMRLNQALDFYEGQGVGSNGSRCNGSREIWASARGSDTRP